MNRTAVIILYRRQAIRIPKELRRMANFQVDVIISSLKELQKGIKFFAFACLNLAV